MGQDPDEVPRHRRTEAGTGARRRTQSSSRAEEIVTCELKARKAQPDHPIHSPCDSLLSWSSSFSNYEGLFNWGALLLFLGCTRICLTNLLRYGVRVSARGWIKFLCGDIFHEDQVDFPVLYLVLYSLVPPLVALILEKQLAKSQLEWKTGCVLHILNLAVHLIMPIVMINQEYLNIGLISSVLACGMYTTIFLKLISYIQVNKWCRDTLTRRTLINKHMYGNGDFLLRERKKTFLNMKEYNQRTEKDEKKDDIEIMDKHLVHWPSNLTLKDMFYFILVPTLCYELNFPRTGRIRKFFLLRRVLEVFLGTNLMLALIQQWIVPNVVDTLVPFDSLDWPLTLERVLKLSLPNHVLWLAGFYLYFHSFLNTAGELLQFADRDFYHDWWNSRNLEKFWQNWNLPVHKWCVRHMYKPVLHAGFSKFQASMVVFFFSAFFHEYLVSVPLRMFKPWAFLGMMGQVPLIFFSKKIEAKFGYQLGNLTVWASLIIGHPLAIMVYYHDFVIENYGHSLVAFYGQINSATL